MGLKELIFKEEIKAVKLLQAKLKYEASKSRDLERYAGRLEKAIRKMQTDLNNLSARITKLERKPKKSKQARI